MIDPYLPVDFGTAQRPDVTPHTLPSRRKRVVPAAPTTKNRPRTTYGPSPSFTGESPPTRQLDPGLWAVYDQLLRFDPTGARTSFAIREAFDQAYDGQRTGRWDYSQLLKTEKTHIGTLVEIWLQREFLFEDGVELDYRIAGRDVDAKWSRNLYDWEIPLEMYSRGDKIAMTIWANEYTARWALGLIRISEEVLSPPTKQRDRKRHLSAIGRDRILWVHQEMPLIENTLLHLAPHIVEQIRTSRSGQAAVETLFRNAQRHLINRATVATAGQQVDSSKRVRDARKRLAPEGIVIFGHYDPHPDLAESLGLPRPTLGRFVSARLATWNEGDSERVAKIGGKLWRLARLDDPEARAPVLPTQGRDD